MQGRGINASQKGYMMKRRLNVGKGVIRIYLFQELYSLIRYKIKLARKMCTSGRIIQHQANHGHDGFPQQHPMPILG